MKLTKTLQGVFIASSLLPTMGFGWTLPIFNNTAYTAWIGVHYPGCQSDHVVVSPKQTINVDAHGCLVTKIEGVLAGQGKRFPLNWKVDLGHRDFSIAILDQGNEKFGLYANYTNVNIIEWTQQNIIKPIDFNVVKPIVGIGQTVANIVRMAIIIKDMVGPIKQTVNQIINQIDTLASIKNGKDTVDPIFAILQELTTLPPHFQAILNHIASSMSAIEDIVRPSSAQDADKIKQAAVAMNSISASVDEMTRKIAKLNQMLHTRVKVIADEAHQATDEILTIINK